MIILTGNSLNERHRELNNKVNEAATNGVQFDNIKSQSEKTGVDRLFKIDLANKYKNIDYIIETLKCGDNVYITRALKCTWLYDEEFSHIVQPDYLEQNIFPEMSFKMRRTFLKMIAKHVTNNDRAFLFYNYCVKMALPEIALKFLLYTSEEFKKKAIKERSIFISDENMINIIGNSFVLASTAFEDLPTHKIGQYLKNLSYLYTVSEVGYLDLVEKNSTLQHNKCLGLRISKHIIKNHKDRLFRHTSLYLSKLNKKIIVKYSTPDDVKKYVENLIPSQSFGFWNFYKDYEYILEIIPFPERLQYLRETFNKHYVNEKFEMNIQFYHATLYKLMTKAERESWALKHIEEGLEHFGHGQDYIWYKFVSFEKAYEPIKKYVLIASNADIRLSIVKVLVSSAQSDRDLESLFNYYYQRFVNEMTRNKEIFVDEVLNIHNCYNFDENCWKAFDKILHSMDVYDNMNAYSCKLEYKLIAIIQTILREKELHGALDKHIDDGINLYVFKKQTDKLPQEKVETVYQYMIHYYLKKINNFDVDNYNDEVKLGVTKYIHNLLDLMFNYDKSEKDIPELVLKLIALDMDTYKYNCMLRKDGAQEPNFTQLVLIKDLKKDASLVVSKFPLLQEELKTNMLFNLTSLLRKIKLYFSDMAPKYIQLYKELLALQEVYEKTCDAAVYGILYLAENADIVDFVNTYVPTDPKIDHVNIERKLLYIRTSICKYASVSRPVVPLSAVKKYIVGDYLKFCLPMFKSYEANLQPALLIEFVKFLLKSPASIQKHGLRMAFQCFGIKDLKIIVSDAWNKTKNVSLRLVMYKALFDKILKQDDESSQSDLFEIFNGFTLSIREDDDTELFSMMTRCQFPGHILGKHILSTWEVLNTLPNKPIMISRRANVIRNMADYIEFIMRQDIIESIVSEHIKNMLIEEGLKNKNKNESHINELIDAKWKLTRKYIMYLPSKDDLDRKFKICESLFKEFIKLWDHTEDNVYFVRSFVVDFVRKLEKSIFYSETTQRLHGAMLLKQVLKELQASLPLVEIYDTIWYLRLAIIVANTITDGLRDFAERGQQDGVNIFTESIDKFASEFASLVNEFMEGKIYFSCATSVIKNILSEFSNNRLHSYWPFEVTYDNDYLFFTVSSKLIETETVEHYKLALELLPAFYKRDTRGAFINKVKSIQSEEIKYLLYRKFVSENGFDSNPF